MTNIESCETKLKIFWLLQDTAELEKGTLQRKNERTIEIRYILLESQKEMNRKKNSKFLLKTFRK